jgi:hypothetical protein
MRWLRQKIEEWRAAREALRFADRFHAESRAHFASLSPEEADRQRRALFGAKPGDRGRIVAFKGIPITDRKTN